jgi:hypothetical protein
MDEEFEVVILRSAVLRVRAVSAREAKMIAEQTINGKRGYSEYALDGWEIDHDCEPERTRK